MFSQLSIMEITITTSKILRVLYIIAWIIFVGLCVDAGGYLFNTFYVLFINPEAAKTFWERTDLFSLYNYDHGYFVVITSLITIAGILKAIMFYLIVKLLHDRKVSLAQPFSKAVNGFMFTMCWLAFGIGIFSIWTIDYAGWLAHKGVTMPDLHKQAGGGDVWIFMGVTLFVIAQVFKRGLEIQTENDLTI